MKQPTYVGSFFLQAPFEHSKGEMLFVSVHPPNVSRLHMGTRLNAFRFAWKLTPAMHDDVLWAMQPCMHQHAINRLPVVAH